MLVGKLMYAIVAGLYGILLGMSGAYADTSNQGEDDAWAFKFTPSYYVTTHIKDASDLNLRANHGSHVLWLGYYRRDGEFEQTRTGYEYTGQIPYGQLVSSLQLATHGFAGGSINAQIGDSIYALLGFGRTNTRDYYNLNFDPNDSIVYGLGAILLSKSNFSLFTVKDDRLNTGQIITHAVWRLSPDEQQRWLWICRTSTVVPLPLMNWYPAMLLLLLTTSGMFFSDWRRIGRSIIPPRIRLVCPSGFGFKDFQGEMMETSGEVNHVKESIN